VSFESDISLLSKTIPYFPNKGPLFLTLNLKHEFIKQIFQLQTNKTDNKKSILVFIEIFFIGQIK